MEDNPLRCKSRCGHDPIDLRRLFEGLTTGVIHTLSRAGYHTRAAVVQTSDEELLSVRQLGWRALQNIRAWQQDTWPKHCPTCTCEGRTPEAVA